MQYAAINPGHRDTATKHKTTQWTIMKNRANLDTDLWNKKEAV